MGTPRAMKSMKNMKTMFLTKVKKKQKKNDWAIDSTFKGIQSKRIFKIFWQMPSSVSILLVNGSF